MQNGLGVFSLPARFLFLIFIPALFFMQENPIALANDGILFC